MEISSSFVQMMWLRFTRSYLPQTFALGVVARQVGHDARTHGEPWIHGDGDWAVYRSRRGTVSVIAVSRRLRARSAARRALGTWDEVGFILRLVLMAAPKELAGGRLPALAIL